jgi:hypothetical protein
LTLERLWRRGSLLPLPGARVLALLAFVALFLATRLTNLMALPVFLDEAMHIKAAVTAYEMRRLVGVSDAGKYLPIWIDAAAIAPADDPLRATRLCSVAFGLAAALGLFALGRELYGEAAGLVAACFYLVLPWTLLMDRMALVESLLSALAVWALFCGVRWAASARLLWSLAFGAAIGFAGITKLYGLLLLALPVAFVCFWPNASRRIVLKQAPVVYGWLSSCCFPSPWTSRQTSITQP